MKNFILFIIFAISMKANAGLITFNLSSDTVVAGSAITVEINGSGFAESDMFWFDFNFDNSIFTFDSSSLVSDLALVDTTFGMYDGLEATNESFGLGFLFNDMFSPASGNFNIATFDLVAKMGGISTFGISGVDGFATDPNITPSYSVENNGITSVTSQAASVPEPSTIFMALMALVLFLAPVSRKIK